jgi:spore maturation protein CgeB
MSRYATFICGREWPILGSFISNQSVDNQELPSLVASSTITLNIGRSFNLANERFQLDPSTPGPRTFEAAMAGTVQLYFSDSLEIEDYFVIDQEILLFDSPSSFELQVERLLDQPDLVAKIALAAQKRALAEHTYKNRCTRLLQCCGLI